MLSRQSDLRQNTTYHNSGSAKFRTLKIIFTNDWTKLADVIQGANRVSDLHQNILLVITEFRSAEFRTTEMFSKTRSPSKCDSQKIHRCHHHCYHNHSGLMNCPPTLSAPLPSPPYTTLQFFLTMAAHNLSRMNLRRRWLCYSITRPLMKMSPSGTFWVLCVFLPIKFV